MKSIVWALLLLAGCTTTAVPEPLHEYPPPAALPARPELPDPLTTFSGKKISTRAEWEKERKPELKALFQHYMYGVLPPVTDVSGAVHRSDPAAFGGKATLREISLSIAGPQGPKVELLLVIPNQRSGPAPVFVG